MNTTLSFRKESIQRSSQASETVSQPGGFTEAQGTKHARDHRPITLTTSLTTLL